MKRILLVAISMILCLTIFSGVGLFAEEDLKDVNKQSEVKLTEDQQKELEALHKELFDIHKNILNKYAEYGVLSEEKVNMKLERMEKYQEKLKENGYIPDWHHHKKGDSERKKDE